MLHPMAAISALSLLASCGGGGSPAPTATPSPTPSPGSTGGGGQTAFSYDVEPCYTQVVPNTGGKTVRQMIVPDTLKLNMALPSGFPNGRDLDDAVIDISLAFLFLDLTESGQSLRTFANLPLNPGGNDRPLLADFPYFAPANGSPVLAATTGTSFNFRSDPDTAYVQVDRMGMPAIATALIGSSLKDPYNDANPTADVAGTFRADETAQLTNLMNAIGDDLTSIQLDICAKRI
ncbi:hypothetical protein GCM10011515_02670 [Tsuneonella deserti]|uniref:DUF4331 domain-containing protein n=2 Tax=Tsuneonella deserti TaxID=2035528 RepID=A0ABQ1RYS9_9SPHN|nr:hypothetical protein GCM10011515_02670 [Tsuneonella deserti]